MVTHDDHRDAQEAAQQAEACVRAGDMHRARALYAKAAQAEARALDAIAASKPRTFSILAVSVAALWYKARAYDQVEAAAFRALAAEQTTERARGQLRELLEAAWNERSLLSLGLGSVSDRLIVSLTGGQVGYGSAPLGLAVHAQNSMSSLVTRVAEWLGGFPLRRRGAPSPDLLAVFQLRVGTAQPGSYRFAIDLAGAEQPEPLGSRVKVGDVADKVMDFIDEAKPTKCSTPHRMLDDIVGAWVNSRVVVRGTWVAGEFMATDVQPDENE